MAKSASARAAWQYPLLLVVAAVAVTAAVVAFRARPVHAPEPADHAAADEKSQVASIPQPPAPIRLTLLDNEGGGTLVLTDYSDNPFLAAINKSKQMGIVPVNTEVKVIESRDTSIPTF